MTQPNLLVSMLTVLSLALTQSALAASTTASSAAQGASSAAGSASDSLGTSSNGSSKATGVAAGDYKIMEVLAYAEKPNQVVLKLQAIDGKNSTGQFELTLPQVAFEKSELKAGGIVVASAQTYGIKFANAKTQTAFYLVMHDEVQRELGSNQISG